MPRTKPLPKREREICSRIVEFRTQHGYSRSDVARAMGINRFTLANIERQLSPLKFSMGYNLCQAYDLCLRWLATGTLPILAFTWISSEKINPLGTSLLFSNAYDLHLSALVDAELKNLADSAGVAVEDLGHKVRVKNFAPIGVGKGAAILELMLNNLRNYGATLGDEGKEKLGRRMADLLTAPQAVKDNLDTGKHNSIVADMSAKDVPTWSQLRKTIAKLTAEHGQKAALADKLGVSRQVLGNWLSDGGQGAPNAELTLWLFKWSLDPKL